MSDQQNKVFGVFVGEGGYQLPAFNSQKGPFPPKPNTEGYISIGWPAIGDMRLYEDGYADYLSKFSKVYPSRNSQQTNNALQANMAWRFAFEMKENDWVICPSAATGYLLVGQIIGGYISDFHNESGLHKFVDEAYFHLRKVNWLYILPREDARYSMLNRIGMLTVSESRFSIEELKSILNTNTTNNRWSDKLIEETRNVLDLGFMPHDDFVYMKNINGGFGKIHIKDWMVRKLLIQDSKTDVEYLYTTVDELIAAGWVAD
ncbi:MAG: hypothetical protein Q8N30_16080 [Methylococcales bacterium]|nr:hypothetical protein [Methylococcales bacterium]